MAFVASCSDDDENDPIIVIDELNIVETAQGTSDLSLLVDALIQADADLVATLSAAGPFTVFAPTNAAFAALLEDLGDDYNSLADFDTADEKELLAKVLTYHVIAGTEAFSGDLTDGMMITTVQGEDVTINLNGGVFIGDATDTEAEVITADVATSNGVVHIIDKVLLPQEVLDALGIPTQNIVEKAIATPDLSLLVEALLQADADLDVVLSGTGPFTVFAPTNDAFAALLDDLGAEYNSLADFDTADEKELLVKVLTYHVVAGTEALSTDLMQDMRIETFQGENVSVDLNGGVFIGDATDIAAEVVIPDVLASNGVVHVIDKVLLPQEVINALNPPSLNIVETAQATPNLSLLVEALLQADADLDVVLSGDGPFTVFAPTNDAFAALLDDLGAEFNSLADFDTVAEKELLAKVLTYHVVSGTAAYSTNLTNGMMITTVQGEDVTVNLSGGVFIGDATDTDAQVVIANVATTNGAVHVINKVLLPQEVLDAL
ncbi:fasciclin domain-containing protein [uncultured Muriicola sp.]|uniref:fasciclin domain-containing protein n=1 Tax=uncultured Muriicola sp. TaxID=1583102 RepID=UPI002608307A|nr:fasciclin domain-containing protein [uncultured Muriicola sp.]